MKNNVPIDISVVIPIFNEEENILELYKQLQESLGSMGKNYNIIFVDDGSTDNSFDTLCKIYKKDNNLKVIKLRKNFGQTAAIDAGIKAASGKIIITMDGDLQNNPSDISLLLEEMKKGYDVISGWRYKRNDSLIRVFLSRFAFVIRKFLLGDTIHDSGCTLKAYKKECFENLNLFGEMHRFMPAILSWKGFSIGEVKVTHNPRKKGKSKYNLTRLVKGLLDLLVLRFWMRYSARPIHLFGVLGIFLLMFGFIFGIYLSFIKFCFHVKLSGRPLLFLTVLLLIVGVQLIFFGLLADIMVQIYYGPKIRRYYNIKETLD